MVDTRATMCVVMPINFILLYLSHCESGGGGVLLWPGGLWAAYSIRILILAKNEQPATVVPGNEYAY